MSTITKINILKNNFMSTKYHELLSKSIMTVSNTTTNLRQTILNGSKKIAIMVTMLLTLGASYSFARPADSVSGEISISFKKDFRNGHILSTETHKSFTKLTFKIDEMIMFAYYSENGQLLAVTRNIVSSQLPMNLQMDLKSSYTGYWITELFELSGDNDNCYYVSLENADSKVALRSNGDHWEVYSTTKKQ